MRAIDRRFVQTSIPLQHMLVANSSSNDYHSVVMMVVMMTPMTMAIRLCKRRSREEGDKREHH
jgi:hypothetical protein